MQPKDIAAILKENRGVKIYRPDGAIYKHITEWRNARKSLKNILNGRYWVCTEQEYEILSNRISETSDVWDTYVKLIGEKRWASKHTIKSE